VTAALVSSANRISNPFATRFVRPGSIAYRFQVADDWRRSESHLRDLVDRIGAMQFGAIVGPHGSGKTTLLCSLVPLLSHRFQDWKQVQLTANPSQGFRSHFAHARSNALAVFAAQARLPDGGLLIVDGAEQLGWFARARLLGRIGKGRQSILATCHQPLPGMEVLHQATVDARLIKSLTRDLVDGAPGNLVGLVEHELGKRDLGRLVNVRDFWFELYDLAQIVITHPQAQSQE
jgi:hypothetical protein